MSTAQTLGTGNITRDEAAGRTAGLHIDSYHTTIDIRRAGEQDLATYPVHCVVELDATLTQTFMDFVGESVRRITVNGRVQPVSFDGSRFALTLEPGRNVVEVEATARYSRSGQGLHRFVDPVDHETYLYTQFEPADARRVFPCFEQPDLKAAHHIVVMAPQGWTVRSNQPRVTGGKLKAEDAIPASVRHVFAPTPRLSTYLTAIAAGPWHEVSDHWSSGDGLEVALGGYCRQSLKDFFDADEILTVTKQGLDFYHQHFGFPYPWGKYDQVFVPEYNLGAMENPGCVTFTENYLHRSAATRAQYGMRANTVLHEMAHMWFGDLVTPAWWDDLWLKESFAEFMGAHVSTRATGYTDAWVAFAGGRKAWAYSQDQLPTTHPIVADIADVEAAKQNFDGITYAKGAAVLKQLVAYVGEEAFFAGARAYFRDHAFDVARLTDLLAVLQATSGRDMAAWSRNWLETAGPDELVPLVELADGRITRLAIQQTSLDARTGEHVGRSHRIVVGLYSDDASGALTRRHRLEVELDGRPVTEVDEAVGLPAAELVLVNDEDLTYAKVGLDEHSLATALTEIGRATDPMARALVWSALWNLVRDARLGVEDYLAAVLTNGPTEADTATLTDMVAHAQDAIAALLPTARRPHTTRNFGERAWEAMLGAVAGSDAQLVWARAVASLAGRDAPLAERVGGLLEGSRTVDGLELGAELRWMMVAAMAAQGLYGPAELDEELRRDPTAKGVTWHRRCLAARPSAEVKELVWAELHTPGALPNDHVDAMIAGFMAPGQEELVAGFADRYFAALDEVWQAHSIEIAQRLVRGLFPVVGDAPERADAWLEAHRQAPGALRRLVLEGADHARRARRAQEFNATAGQDARSL